MIRMGLVASCLALIAGATGQARAGQMLSLGPYNIEWQADGVTGSYTGAEVDDFDESLGRLTRTTFDFDIFVSSTQLRYHVPQGASPEGVFHVDSTASGPGLLFHAALESTYYDPGAEEIYMRTSPLTTSYSLVVDDLYEYRLYSRPEKIWLPFIVSGDGTYFDPVDPAVTFNGGNPGWVTGTVRVTFEYEPVAVPEPSTLISGGLAGVFGLGLAWRNRRKLAA